MDLSNFFPAAPSYLPGLLGEEQARLAQQQAQQQGLLGAALGLMQAGAPSRTPISTGQALAQGLAAGQQAYGNVLQQRAREALISQQIAEQQRVLQEQEAARAILPSIMRQGQAQPTLYGQPTAFPLRDEEGNIMPGAGVSQGAPSLDLNAALRLLTAAPGVAAKILPTVQQFQKLGQPERVTLSEGQQVFEMTPQGFVPVAGAPKPEKPSSLQADYEYAMAQRRREGQPTISFEQYQENIRRAGAGSTSTVVYPPGAVAPGASAQSEIDKALLSSGSRLQVLNRISEGYRPEFLQTRFKVAQGLVELGEKLGREPNPEERQNLEQYSRFKQDAVRQLNQYINEITGAAIGQGEEAERLKSGVPNPGTGLFGGDSPTVFLSKLNNTVRDLRLAEARLQYIKTKGFNLQDVTLDQMPTIMRKRKEQIVKDFGLDEANPTDREVLRNRLASEFGLL